MDKKTEALKLALEALEQSETTVPYEGFGMAQREAERKHKAAITAIREALAEQPAAPQRSEDKKQWVGLLLSEANEIANEVYGKTDAWEVEAVLRIDFACAIEAKLREKNNG